MATKPSYTVPNMEPAHRLGEIARLALDAARRRAPDQREHAARLFREIYGPLDPRPSLDGYRARIERIDGDGEATVVADGTLRVTDEGSLELHPDDVKAGG